MSEECGQYKDSTYRILKGLRQNSPSDGSDSRDSSLKVPPKRNTAVLPKYPELNINKSGGLHKKLKEFEVLLLEYEEEEDDVDDGNAPNVTDATGDADKFEDESEIYNAADDNAEIVYEENECNHEGERNATEWRHKKENRNDYEDGKDTLEADGESKKTNGTDTQEGEEENNEDDRSYASVVCREGGKKDDDGSGDTPVVQSEKEKDDRDIDYISAAQGNEGRKQNFEGDDNTAANGSGKEKDNDKECDASVAPVDGLGPNVVHVFDTDADHTNDEGKEDLDIFEDGIKEVKTNMFHKNTDSDANKNVSKDDDVCGNDVLYENEMEIVKYQGKEPQTGIDIGFDDDDDDNDHDDDEDDEGGDEGGCGGNFCDYYSDPSQSAAQVAEYDDCWNDDLTNDTLSQYSDIQTDTEHESDDDIDERDGPMHSPPSNEYINGQTQTQGVEKKDIDDQAEDDSMSGILGLYANSQYDVEFLFHKYNDILCLYFCLILVFDTYHCVIAAFLSFCMTFNLH